MGEKGNLVLYKGQITKQETFKCSNPLNITDVRENCKGEEDKPASGDRIRGSNPPNLAFQHQGSRCVAPGCSGRLSPPQHQIFEQKPSIWNS